MTGHLCTARLYTYKGVDIEIPGIGPPWPLKSNGDPYIRLPRAINAIVEEFCKLKDDQVQAYRTGGGCISF
jgi:hypothetical protein